MRKTSHGVTIRLAKWSGGDVALECLVVLGVGAFFGLIVVAIGGLFL